MITPQQLADAIDEARCTGTMEAIGALIFETHPEHAALLRNMPFGKQAKPRARADGILLYREMGVTDPRIRAAVIAKLHGPALAYKLATGNGLERGINPEGLRITDLICSNPERKAKRLAVLRAVMVSFSRPIKGVCAADDDR